MKKWVKTTKYISVFFDLDRTLWDFDSSALMAFQDIYEKYKLDATGFSSVKKFYEIYTKHNEILWEKYRAGEITKEKLRGLRFHLTLSDFGIEDAAGDNIKVTNTDGITIRNVKSAWTGIINEKNGAYGLRPNSYQS